MKSKALLTIVLALLGAFEGWTAMRTAQINAEQEKARAERQQISAAQERATIARQAQWDYASELHRKMGLPPTTLPGWK